MNKHVVLFDMDGNLTGDKNPFALLSSSTLKQLALGSDLRKQTSNVNNSNVVCYSLHFLDYYRNNSKGEAKWI
jgi:hypothetical protein